MTRRIFLLLLAAALLAGCASMENRKEWVKVTVTNLRILDSTLMEQRYLVTLRLQNRHNEELPVAGMSFDLELNDKDFASGVSNQPVTVPAFGEATIDVKLSSSLFGLIRQLQSAQEMEHEPFRYRVSGKLGLIDSSFSVPFEQLGEIDLRQPARQPSGTAL